MSEGTPRVRVLPEAVANQIAAGEVVDRPASVVKELLENALDAGARRVKVEVVGGGQRSLRVVDDGHGMGEDDARLALTRHATSKLTTTEDLLHIATLGFRGEALPSIASVSRFELSSALAGAPSGTRIRVEGGGPLTVEVAPAVTGTAVEVSDLFFNVPARRKFLRKPATEVSHVTDVVARLALAHPEVGFKLLAEGRSVFDAPAVASGGADERARLARILGKTMADGLQALEEEALSRAVRVRGYFGAPPLSERGGRGQHVFVNGRFVRDQTLQQAIAEAYQGRLPKGRRPVVVLFIELDPSEVDVNVHPQKTEVRFARPGELFRAVQGVLRRALARVPTAPSLDPEGRRRVLALAAQHGLARRSVEERGEAERREEEAGSSLSDPRPRGSLSPQAVPPPFRSSGLGAPAALEPRPREEGSLREAPPPSVPLERVEEGPPKPDRFFHAEPTTNNQPLESAERRPAGGGVVQEHRYRGHGERLIGALASGKPLARWVEEPRASYPREPVAAAGLPLPKTQLSSARRLGVVLGRYLVLDADGALWLVDLAGVAARVAAEADTEVARSEPVQPLLLPVEVELGAAEKTAVEAALAPLQAAGLEIRVQGETVQLHGAPLSAEGLDLAALVRGAAAGLLQDRDPQTLVPALIKEAKVERARQAALPTEPAAVEALLARLERCSIRDRAPDGRPLVVTLSLQQVASLFGNGR